MSSENVEIVRNGIQTWMRGDVASASAFWDEEIEWIAPPEDPDQQAVVVGAAAAADALANWLATWDVYGFELTELVDAGDDVIQAGRQVMSVRGAEVSSEIFFVWTFRQGRAIRMQMFYHRGQALEAAGVAE